MDFTLKLYISLLETLKDCEFSFLSLHKYFATSGGDDLSEGKNITSKKQILLRHDIDKLPSNALKIAEKESGMNIESTYYFRTNSSSYDEKIIKRIAKMGHEIGYHYENMDTCNGDIYKAWDNFRRNLEKLREFYPVKTICMHGSPLSKYDNRDLWEKYDYRSEGIIGEPYFDIDFDEVFYLTDTGRRWDRGNISVRDKVRSDDNADWPTYSSTFDIIEAVEEGAFPEKAMINVHPHRLLN